VIVALAGDPFAVEEAVLARLSRLGMRRSDATWLGEGASVEDISRGLAQAGLFGESAIILEIMAAFPGREGDQARARAVEAGAASSGTLLVIDPECSAARERLYREQGELERVGPRGPGDVARWLAQRMKDAGLEVRAGAAEALVACAGTDLRTLSWEVEKLALLGGAVDAHRATWVVGREPESNTFALIDAALGGDRAGAAVAARRLLEQGESEYQVLATLCGQLATLAHLAAGHEAGLAMAAAARSAGANPTSFGTRKLWGRAEQVSLAQVRRAVALVRELDLALKTGGAADRPARFVAAMARLAAETR
jgi:DNA polymerase III delta subunit